MAAKRITILSAIMGGFLVAGAHGAAQVANFHDKVKLPSSYTIEKQQQFKKFPAVRRYPGFRGTDQGLCSRPRVQADHGRGVARGLGHGQVRVLLRRQDVDSIHPSRQRQAILNMNYCLYKVIPGIYQVLHADQVQLPTARGC